MSDLHDRLRAAIREDDLGRSGHVPTWMWIEVYRGGQWQLFVPDLVAATVGWSNPTTQWHEVTWLANEAHAKGYPCVRCRLADGRVLFDSTEAWE